MSAFLEGRGLVKQFGQTRVLDGIDFSIQRGQCLVLLGPSGCGKTTLLNIIAGLAQADGGELVCDGQLLDAPQKRLLAPMGKRGFAMVFQDFSLWPHMPVLENVAFGLRLKKCSRSEARQKAMRALERVQMAEFAARRPAQLSGGQQQRVAIARALAVEPRLLLLDEPLSALDAKLREDLKGELAALLRESGITAVYVTHDQSEAFSLGDQVALMRAGRIEQMDAPEQLYRRPRTRFAAEFIGAANLLPYQLVDGGLHIGQQLQLHALNGRLRELPASGHLVIRRESVRVLPRQESGGPGMLLHGICRARTFLGDRQEVVAEVQPGLTLRGFATHTFTSGAPVSIRIDEEILSAVVE